MSMPDHQGRVDGPRPRFPIPRYPTGWFQVAWSHEMEVGQATPAEAFGQQLVASYATKIPSKANVPCWPTHEVNGLVMVWHDIDKGPPRWEIPALPEFSGGDEWAEPFHRMRSPTTMTTPGGQVEGQVESISLGFGYATNRFTGLVDTLLIGATTPIDDEYVQVRFTFTVKRFGGRDITRGVGTAFVAEISRQLEQDKVVWENEVYFERPLLCDGDGPFMMLRKWGRQFFPDWYLKEARDAFRRAATPAATDHTHDETVTA